MRPARASLSPLPMALNTDAPSQLRWGKPALITLVLVYLFAVLVGPVLAIGYEVAAVGLGKSLAALLAPEAELSRSQRVQRRALLSLKGHFQLDNLLLFNRKFFPLWQRRFVVFEHRRDLPRVGIAALTAESYLPFGRPS